MRKVSDAKFLDPTRRGEKGNSMGTIVDLSFLKGKRIIDVGTIDQSQLTDCDSGRLAIDYEDNGKIMRAVFDYGDLGFWLEWKGEKGKESPEEVIQKKIRDVWGHLERARDRKRLKIVDDALQRRYVFMDNDQEVLALSCVELRIMGPSVYSHFHGSDRKVDEVFEDIRKWVID